MTTKFVTGAQPPHDPAAEMLPDPPQKHDMLQEPDATVARYTLRTLFEERSEDVIVRGEGYLRTRMGPRGEWETELYPDCMVAFGVDPRGIERRNGYVISEMGKPPDFVLEVASESTGRRDTTVKRVGYARLGVPEYWRFDRTGGEYHGAALAGDRLVNREYEPIEVTSDEDGVVRGYSEVLGLTLCWVEGRLRFYDPVSGEYLRTYSESEAERQAAKERAAAAELEVHRLREQIRSQQ